jgi:hypothetical protein
MGGWYTPQTPNPRDVWKSADGKNWECVCEVAPWEKSDLPAFMVFDDKMWHMGGRSLPGTECSNEVYWSEDGGSWHLATDNAAWSPRLGSGCAVFRDRMWIFGGTSDFYHSNDDTLSNEIWSSADGVNWELECAEASWCKRAYHKVVELDGKLWMTAGGGVMDGVFVCNDVWCSEDGVNWECVCEQAPWPARVWHGSVSYRGHIWVLAGWAKDHGGNVNDIWFSKDGAFFNDTATTEIYTKRHEVTTSNEVWNIQLPPDFGA